MKKLKLFSCIAAAVSSAVILTSAVCAYDFGNKDLGKNWSLNATVPASEFSELTADSYVTVTFDADQSEEEYWSIKPMDSTWAFIDPNGEGGPELAEGKDAYPVQKEDTSITFKIPADFVESVKSGGMVFIGHSITLKTLTVSSEAPVTEAAPAETEAAPAETEAAPAQTEANVGNTDAAAPTQDKSNADTGVEGVAALAGIAAVAAAALVISKKR